jgi:holo-[acyl-carrier protein] synthase
MLMSSLQGTETIRMNREMSIRVGADIAAAGQVADSVAHFGDRYLQRIYTEHERTCCTGSPAVQFARLAARFAAKEATIKVLRPTGHQPDWRSIEVRRDPEGWCSISLSGHASVLAEQAGITELAVSLTHEEGVAAAVVVALCHISEMPTDEVEMLCESSTSGVRDG